MYFPPWRQSLARSLHKHRSKAESKYFQVASIDSDGKPRNRTMVHRGFLENSNSIITISDIRSAKFCDFSNLAEAEICWYFTLSREQYRIYSEVMIHSNIHITSEPLESKSLLQEIWNTLSEAAKSQFYWPLPKADVISEEDRGNFTSDLEKISSPIGSKTPPNNFAIIIFSPTEVDYLQLKTQPQTRLLYNLNKPKLKNTVSEKQKWHEKRVNP